MIESAKLDRLLTQVNCRITNIVRLRDAGAISEREAEQELKQAVKFRAELMRQIDLTPRAVGHSARKHKILIVPVGTFYTIHPNARALWLAAFQARA
jgi:hypothetical protein